MKKTLHISLVFLLSGVLNLLALTSAEEMICCHNPAPQKEETHSCCEMEQPVEQSPPTCNMFEMAPSSFDNCGCIHELISFDETVLANVKVEFSQTLFVESNIVSDFSNNTSYSNNTLYNLVYQNSIPIYISVSSYLI